MKLRLFLVILANAIIQYKIYIIHFFSGPQIGVRGDEEYYRF